MPRRIVTIVLAAVLVIPALFAASHAAHAGSSDVELLKRFLQSISPPAMAQDHQFLVDTHAAAGVTCAACHREVSPPQAVGDETCVACHGTYAEMAALTPWEPNPHQSHMGELECATCHKMHTASESFCDKCHSFGMEVP